MSASLTREQRIWRWKILASTYVGYIGYYFTRKIFTICKTTMRDDLGWQLADTAYIWTMFLLAYMLGQFITSFVGRKWWGPRVLLLGGLGISIICGVIFSATHSYWVFMVFMFINGLVQATGWPASVGTVSQWAQSKERGTLMGWWTTNHILANFLFKGIGGFLLTHGLWQITWFSGTLFALRFNEIMRPGWRPAFFGCTVLALLIWVILYFWQRDKPEDLGLAPIADEELNEGRAVNASQEANASMGEYFQIFFHPLVLAMGCGYFCIKFLRYALDSWLPAFLNIQGMAPDQASYFSAISDITGILGTILAGWALDKMFRGNWANVCLLMGIGAVGAYIAVICFSVNAVSAAICFGLVGFMIYGPDSILTGAAAMSVAGGMNAVAVSGIVNGIGSMGPIVQEIVNAQFMKGADPLTGIRQSNIMGLSASVVFVVLMVVIAWRMHVTQKRRAAAETR